jgi:cytochrome c oxidase subunit II
MSSNNHLTSRRAFIAALGFGGVSLYGLWAGYGAAPGPLSLLGLGDHDDKHGAGGHGGHGAAVDGPTQEEFSRLTAEFIERYRLPDGTVHPRMLASAHAGHQPGDSHGNSHEAAAGHHDPAAQADDNGQAAHAHEAGDEPLDVYLAAGKWYYQPHALRLDAGKPYRFRMMAIDVSHGASIQLGSGGRMIRLRPGRLNEMELTFHEPGRHLVYCTVYCGDAHDYMQATIEVV